MKVTYPAGAICPSSYMYHVIPSGQPSPGMRVECEDCHQKIVLTGTGRYRKHLLQFPIEVTE